MAALGFSIKLQMTAGRIDYCLNVSKIVVCSECIATLDFDNFVLQKQNKIRLDEWKNFAEIGQGERKIRIVLFVSDWMFKNKTAFALLSHCTEAFSKVRFPEKWKKTILFDKFLSDQANFFSFRAKYVVEERKAKEK